MGLSRTDPSITRPGLRSFIRNASSIIALQLHNCVSTDAWTIRRVIEAQRFTSGGATGIQIMLLFVVFCSKKRQHRFTLERPSNASST